MLARGPQPGSAPNRAPGALVIGRDPSCDVVIDDPLVSRRHAKLTPEQDGFRVTDLHSSNGTYVNSRRITTAHLGPGDQLSIGRTRLVTHDGRLDVARPEHPTLVADQLSFTLRDGRTLLHDVTFELPESCLLAVIGPSGAGKSTLLKALTGSQPATSGQVVYEDQDLYQNYQGLCRRIGVVPQDDLVHRQLTVRQALSYAAALRLPRDYSAQQREAEVNRVLADLDLVEHSGTVVSRLSGGQRKRVSVALELLTQPSLLLLDEPTSGLDPHLDRSVMRLLRDQADRGRVVVVITHSVANLSMCDRVLLLTPGGRTAYFGPPEEVREHFGSDDWADIFEAASEDPEGCQQRFTPPPTHSPTAPTAPSAHPRKKARNGSSAHQLRTLVSRQVRVLRSDRNYVLASLLMPVLVGLMALLIPGDTGFGPAGIDHPGEPSVLLTIMVIGAAFMGVSDSIRELVTERPIFLRERAVGLSQSAYLASKTVVLVVLCLVQSALLTAVVLVGKPAPGDGVLLGPGWVELGVACFGTAFASAMIGLTISSVVSTGEQVMPAMVVHVMAQLVMCGGIITVSGRRFMEILAAPTRAAGDSPREPRPSTSRRSGPAGRRTGCGTTLSRAGSPVPVPSRPSAW